MQSLGMQVYPVPKSSVTIRHYLIYADLVSYLLFSYFLKHSYILKEPHHLFNFTIPSQFGSYITLDILFLSGVPLLGALHEAMFDY